MPEVKEEKPQLKVNTETDVTTRYTYVIATKNEPRGKVFDEAGNKRPDAEYPARRNVLLRSSIVWPSNTIDPFSGKPRQAGRHLIRYYDGCTSLFVDDQPKEKETIDQLIASTRELYLVNGYAHIFGYDRMLKLYMDWCSWNSDSPYRVAQIDPVFRLLDAEKEREMEAVGIDEMEKALENAKNADVKKMRVHAHFMDVPTIDFATSLPLSDKAVRTEYRKAAMSDPKRFNRTFNDKNMHLKYWIEKAIETGEISTTKIPNTAAWAKKGVTICDISGLQSYESILHKLIEFASSTEGEDFNSQLKALYN